MGSWNPPRHLMKIMSSRHLSRVNPFEHYFFTQKVISRSIYNLKIDTIYMYDMPFDRSFLQLSNGIRHVMPSTDKARINSKGIDGSKRLTDDCVFQ